MANNKIDCSKILFRCSQLSKIMAKAPEGELPKGAITELKKIWREMRWGREQEIKSKYLEKGKASEPLALTLLSVRKGIMLRQNDVRIENLYLSGLPDNYIGESIKAVRHGYDTKCPYTWAHMPDPDEALNPIYYWQNNGYMALTKSPLWTTAYCLVNSPAFIIDDEKRRIKWKNNWSDWDADYLEAARKIERDHIVDYAMFKKHNPGYDLVIKQSEWDYDIPAEERLLEYTVARDESVIKGIYTRIDLCREKLIEWQKNPKKLLEN